MAGVTADPMTGGAVAVCFGCSVPIGGRSAMAGVAIAGDINDAVFMYGWIGVVADAAVRVIGVCSAAVGNYRRRVTVTGAA